MNLAAPSIVVGGGTSPAAPFQSFREHVVKAFDLTDSAIANLTQAPGMMNIMDSGLIATLDAKAAVSELGLALMQDAPESGIAAARSAADLLATGVNALTNRVNGPLTVTAIADLFTDAKSQMQVALDSVGAAQPR